MLHKAQIIHENDLKNGFAFVYLLYTKGNSALMRRMYCFG